EAPVSRRFFPSPRIRGPPRTKKAPLSRTKCKILVQICASPLCFAEKYVKITGKAPARDERSYWRTSHAVFTRSGTDDVRCQGTQARSRPHSGIGQVGMRKADHGHQRFYARRGLVRTPAGRL